MKIVHYTQYNRSGMNAVAESIAKEERRLGLDSHILNIFDEKDWSIALDADVHVAHTWFPDFYQGTSFRRQLKKDPRIVSVFHGTPDFIFTESFEVSRYSGYGHGDGLMTMFYWLQNADARVTFWPRHQAIYQTMVDRGTEVDCIPLGVDHEFWKAGSSKGKWAGNPSVWSGENPHLIKWPYDLVTLWPWVWPQLEGASLHLVYLAQNMHRQFAPLMDRNGAAYGMHWSALTFNHVALRDIFKSIDFFIGLVRYGDFNRLSHEANVGGAKTISYRGNPYSDFWLTEGDQREVARELLSILRGDVEPRQKDPVPEIAETAAAMQTIYERIVAKKYVPGFSLPFSPVKVKPPVIVTDLRPEAMK